MPIQFVITPSIQTLIDDFNSVKQELPQQELLSAWQQFSSKKQTLISYTLLKYATQTLNRHYNQEKYLIRDLFDKNSIQFEMSHNPYLVPEKPIPKTKEFLKRTEELKRKLEDEEYASMVKDIVTKQIEKEKSRDPFYSFRGQLGAGVDIVITMFTFFCVFYFASASLGYNETTKLIFGAIGLIVGFLVDVVLVIIRSDLSAKNLKKKEQRRHAATGAVIGTSKEVPASKPLATKKEK